MSYKIEVPWPEIRPLFRYVNEVWGLKCLRDILDQGLFPNAKEITESMSVFNAVRRSLKHFALSDPEITLISVADGNTPRTAALFAYRTAWQCVSIDPRLKKDFWPGIRRLACIQKKIEDCEPRQFEKLVVVAVHSHAPLDVACMKFAAMQRAVVAMPCCVPQVRERPPDLEYVDKGVWSPKNTLMIWRDYQTAVEGESDT